MWVVGQAEESEQERRLGSEKRELNTVGEGSDRIQKKKKKGGGEKRRRSGQ